MTKKKDKEKYSYCFPNILAKAMKKVDDRTQMEASLLSMSFLLAGIVFICVYVVGFGEFGWWFKGMTIFNTLCAFVFLSSYLVTTYQQYVSYMLSMEIIGEVGTDEPFGQPIQTAPQITQQIENKQPNIRND